VEPLAGSVNSVQAGAVVVAIVAFLMVRMFRHGS